MSQLINCFERLCHVMYWIIFCCYPGPWWVVCYNEEKTWCALAVIIICCIMVYCCWHLFAHWRVDVNCHCWHFVFVQSLWARYAPEKTQDLLQELAQEVPHFQQVCRVILMWWYVISFAMHLSVWSSEAKGAWYRAFYVSQTHNQQHLTVWEVAADWQNAIHYITIL